MKPKRCTKRDEGKPLKAGCVKAAGHGGRCKVRDDPKKLFAAGGEPAKPRAAKRAGAGGRGKNPIAELAALAAVIGRIEVELGGCIERFDAVMSAMQQRVAAAKAQATARLKTMIAMRKKLERFEDV